MDGFLYRHFVDVPGQAGASYLEQTLLQGAHSEFSFQRIFASWRREIARDFGSAVLRNTPGWQAYKSAWLADIDRSLKAWPKFRVVSQDVV